MSLFWRLNAKPSAKDSGRISERLTTTFKWETTLIWVSKPLSNSGEIKKLGDKPKKTPRRSPKQNKIC